MFGKGIFCLVMLHASWSRSIDYSSIITEEWTYRNVMTQSVIGAVGWLSMFIGFGTTYHYYKLVQEDKVRVLEIRIAELKGEEPYDEELIINMETLLHEVRIDNGETNDSEEETP